MLYHLVCAWGSLGASDEDGFVHVSLVDAAVLWALANKFRGILKGTLDRSWKRTLAQLLVNILRWSSEHRFRRQPAVLKTGYAMLVRTVFFF